MKKYMFLLFGVSGCIYYGCRDSSDDKWISKNATYEISSRDTRWHIPENEPGLLNGESAEADWAFHTPDTNSWNFTKKDLYPYIIIDLKDEANIRTIDIFNRKSFGLQHRANGLTIWISNDKAQWQKIWQAQTIADRWIIDTAVKARFVKMGFEEKKFMGFHLSRVNIYGAFD